MGADAAFGWGPWWHTDLSNLEGFTQECKFLGLFEGSGRPGVRPSPRLSPGCVRMGALPGFNLEQGPGSSIPVPLKVSTASGTPTFRGLWAGKQSLGSEGPPLGVPHPSLRSPGQGTPHPRMQGGRCQQLQAPSSSLSFPRLSGLSVYVCTILSHQGGQVCRRSTWRIGTKWAGSGECAPGGPGSPAQRHRTSLRPLPAAARGQGAGTRRLGAPRTQAGWGGPRTRLRATGTCRVSTAAMAHLKGWTLRPRRDGGTCRMSPKVAEERARCDFFRQLPGLGISFR